MSKFSLLEDTKKPLSESECKVYLIITLSVALTFCVLSATIVIVACLKKYQDSKINALNRHQAEKEEQQRTDQVKKEMQQPNFGPYYPQMAVAANSRPVTVRSVKRRDKAKVEERRMSQQQKRPLDDNAVMV